VKTATAAEARSLGSRLLSPRTQAMTAVGVAALGFTAIAYMNMVPFLRDDLGWPAEVAWTLGGVFEIALIALGLLGRWAALEQLPFEKFLMWTWLFAAMSGAFAAVHMLNAGMAWGPVLFAFAVPLVAALVWHFALGMEVKAIKGIDWVGRRRQRQDRLAARKGERLVRKYVRACQRTARLEHLSDGSPAALRSIEKSRSQEIAAEDAALDLLGVEDFEKRLKKHAALSEAMEGHRQRVRATSMESSSSKQTAQTSLPAEAPVSTTEASPRARAASPTARPVAVPGLRSDTEPARKGALPNDPGTNADIVNMKAADLSNAKIGAKFGVDASTISRRLKKIEANAPRTPISGVPVVPTKELATVG
jgi:hypothetical protein